MSAGLGWGLGVCVHEGRLSTTVGGTHTQQITSTPRTDVGEHRSCDPPELAVVNGSLSGKACWKMLPGHRPPSALFL